MKNPIHILFNVFPWVILLAVGIALVAHGTQTEQANFLFTGAMFIFVTLAVLLFWAIEQLLNLPRENSTTLKTSPEPTCVLCNGGPSNAFAPTCRCGFELWDNLYEIDPAE